MLYNPSQNNNKILLIRFSALGDIVILSCLIEKIATQYNEYKIDLVTKEKFKDIYKYCPYIDKIIILKESATIFDLYKLSKILKYYSIVIDAHESLRSKTIKLFAIGKRKNQKEYSIKKQSWKLDWQIKTKRIPKNQKSRIESYLEILPNKKNKTDIYFSTRCYIPEKIKNKINKKYKNIFNPNLVAIAPGAGSILKKWPIEYFCQLINNIKGITNVAIIGDNKEIEPKIIYDKFLNEVTNLAGKLSILETAEFLRNSNVVISNDSAGGHIAESVGTPAIVIFGPTLPGFGFAPYLKKSQVVDIDLYCRPCSKHGKGKCKNPVKLQCLKNISVENVQEKVMTYLNH